MQEEINNSINCLDITIYKTDQGISFNNYRKPTATDTIIPNDSCHPHEHKMKAIRYLANRAVSYPMNGTNKKKEYHTAKQTLLNNQYDTKILDKVLEMITLTKNTETKGKGRYNHTKPITKWAKLTYEGNQTKFITKLFKNTNTKISFTTENTTAKLLTQINKGINSNKFNRNVVYQLTCKECNKKYIGQTGKPFH